MHLWLVWHSLHTVDSLELRDLPAFLCLLRSGTKDEPFAEKQKRCEVSTQLLELAVSMWQVQLELCGISFMCLPPWEECLGSGWNIMPGCFCEGLF